MKLIIQSDGMALRPQNRQRLGNVISQPLSKLASGELHLELELPNTHCNVGGEDPTSGQRACLTCPRNIERFRPETDRVNEILQAVSPQLESVAEIKIAGIAEPFWRDRIFEVLGGLGIGEVVKPKVITTTNGTLLDAERTQRWFETVENSEVSFSVDAGQPKTYFLLRRIAEFDRVLRNFDNYNRTRNPEKHVSVLRNHINLLNIDEIDRMIQMTKDYFFHYIALSPTRPVQKKLHEICANRENQSRFVDARAKAESLAGEIGVNVVFSKDWPE